ncbi:hypothetical protein MPTK1_4g01940 [Marchantia polymorpha subsp. ruderalis]|uniref:Uncharacterized protein n=2 Tax=Marchantia polymorpha TaxID=3197 RepID=A0AAF6B5C6_MARPO|nr:hypothetical protein MARPO_0098s0005 [Marchantia polymorpha]BBN07210.1 hypothetical protein Mp_4g01940 [Marchantia polymorpha subsp. ruderalis]|eukprot:PTQ32448.1 hypothetical protein MARPO_0098s0005 [Marchantia polymorpha]
MPDVRSQRPEVCKFVYSYGVKFDRGGKPFFPNSHHSGGLSTVASSWRCDSGKLIFFSAASIEVECSIDFDISSNNRSCRTEVTRTPTQNSQSCLSVVALHLPYTANKTISAA